MPIPILSRLRSSIRLPKKSSVVPVVIVESLPNSLTKTAGVSLTEAVSEPTACMTQSPSVKRKRNSGTLPSVPLVSTSEKIRARATKPKIDPLTPESIELASPERLGCQQCGLWATCRSPFIRPFIPEGWTGKLLLIGEAPGAAEDRDGRPFNPNGGKSGELLQKLWRAAGYRDVDVALANANICRPPNNRTPTMREVRACRSLLLGVIHGLRPRYVVGLGTVAARALTNDGDATATGLRGRRLTVPGLTEHALPLYTPGVPEQPALVVREPVVNSEALPVDRAPLPNCTLEPLVGSRTGLSDPPGYTPTAVAVTYHPAATFYNRGNRDKRISPALIIDDLRRVAENEILPPGLTPPSDTPSVIAVDSEWAADGTITTASVATASAAYAVEGYPNFWLLAPYLRAANWIVGHAVPQDIEKLIELKLPIKEEWAQGRRVLDSLTVVRMVNENLPSYKLEDLLAHAFTIQGWKAETEADLARLGDMGGIDRDRRTRRCALDAWGALRLVEKYAPVLRRRQALLEFQHRIAASLSRFTLAGAVIDLPYLQTLKEELGATVFSTADQVRKAAYATGKVDWACGIKGCSEFHLTNDNHLRELLYDRLGLESVAETPKGLDSVGKNALAALGHPVADLIRQHNAAEKLYSTNIVGVERLLHPVGYLGDTPVALLDFHFDPLGARTGRRSSSNPNSQNWSKRVRGLVRSRFTNGTIGDHDYSKLEPNILGWLAKEPYLLDRFGAGGTGYSGIARDMWKRDVPEGTREYTSTKSVILGVHYGMKDDYMAEQFWNMVGDNGQPVMRFSTDYRQHARETAKLRASYLRLIPNAVRFMAHQEAMLDRDGFIVAPDGMVRHLELPEGRFDKGHNHAVNQAINFPIQRMASAVTGAAILDIEAAFLAERGLSYRDWIGLLTEVRKKLLTNTGESGIICNELGISVLFNEVHDDIVVDLYPSTAARDREIIRDCMRNVRTLRALVPSFTIPLNVGIKEGSRWGEKE